MKPKPTTVDSKAPLRVAFLTLDNHLSSAALRASHTLQQSLPGLTLSMHTAADWSDNQAALDGTLQAIDEAHIIIVTMLFMDDHIQPVLPALIARKDQCDAMVCCMSAPEVVRLTRLGRLSMDRKTTGPMALLKRLRGAGKKKGASSGAKQLSVLRMLPRILRFVPGTAQDLRAYLLTLQYWLAGSEENFRRMVLFLVSRYAEGPRQYLRDDKVDVEPICYPDLGVYHPQLKSGISESIDDLPRPHANGATVGVIVMRSYLLAGNTAHYDRVIQSLEDRGLNVVTAFATGLDARPVAEQFFLQDGKSTVDAVVSLTGFSLVGGPAYNDSAAAESLLSELDVPYIVATPVELQSLEQWQRSNHGLMPVEATMMVAIPELDGATGPIIFGGRSEDDDRSGKRDLVPHAERIEQLTARVERVVSLRKTSRAERKVAIVLFNFPPNAGNTGTAAHLGVFESLFNTLGKLAEEGYQVDVPDSVDALREMIVEGNAMQYGTHANVHSAIAADDYIRDAEYLEEIEDQWGPAPGRIQSDGRSVFVLGVQLGNVLIGVQPGMGYEGDPMRLLFEHGFAPTHAFSAFYQYLKNDFNADAVLHFGTHGALEFMPGKQVGMSASCWPDRLIGALPNYYLYASNNPSEGMIAKRRAAATLISYLTPPVTQAELYRELADLNEAIGRWRTVGELGDEGRRELVQEIQAGGVALDLIKDVPSWDADIEHSIETLRRSLLELEETLIPDGLHVVGESLSRPQKLDLVIAMADAGHDVKLSAELADLLIDGTPWPGTNATNTDALPSEEVWQSLLGTTQQLGDNQELEALVTALDGRYIRPAPGGDLLKNPGVLPSGRNIHGFDPFHLPSRYAVKDGARQAELVVARHVEQGNNLPESIALVLWGTDNLKSEGGGIAQALALMGAEPNLDSYGRVSGARLIPLETLGRPRIDVVITLSGIFRDLLPLQTRLLADAAYLAATADEPAEQNFVRKHALAYQVEHDCDMETAALRVFSNAEGAYGSNVNMLVDNGAWEQEDELAEVYSQRKCFAYSRSGKTTRHSELLNSVLSGVDLACQNLDSVELGVTTVDHYFDTLGGISRAVRRSTGKDIPVYISDQTTASSTVRTLSEQLALETRTRVLNPKWYEGILKHGYEGVQQIESHVTNTVGWSATTGQVAPWIYENISKTFVLDDAMRNRLSSLNPSASVKVAQRLIEACERSYWNPDQATLEALRSAGDDLEDRLEGITQEAAA